MTLPTEPVPVGPELPGVIVDWISPINNSAISSTPRETLDRVNDTFERQINVAAQGDVCRVTYGTDRLGAQILTALNYGSGILVVCMWGRGECHAIGSFTVDNVTPPATVIATHYTGTTSQTVDAKLVSAFGALGITHTNALPGIAYDVIEFQSGADIADIHAIVQGVKVYDPRDGTQTLGTRSTYKWSDNPALAVADVITNATYGLGASIDWASVTAAANACDALVSGEKKRIVGITLDTRQSAEAWIDVLRAHAGCWVVRNGNTYKLIPDAPASSVATFGKNDIIKGTNKWSMLPINSAPNVVEVTYTDTRAVPWTTATAVYPANALPPSGEDLYISRRSYPGVTRYSQALREAIEFFNHSRLESLTEEFATFTPALTIEPGDVITLNNGGLSAGIAYRVLSKPMARKGRFTIRGRKYDPAAFDSSAVAAPTTANTTLPSAGTPPTLASLTLTESTLSTGNAFTVHLQLVWPAVVWPFFKDYRVMIYDEGTLIQDSATTAAGFTSQPVAIGHNYRAFVYVRSSGAQGAGVMRSITVSGSAAAAPGEMLWAAYPIEPNATYEPKAFQRGLGDPQRHSYIAANAYGFAEYRPPGFFVPSTMSAVGVIDQQLDVTGTGSPPPIGGNDFTIAGPDRSIGWQSDVITLFGGAHRVCRLAVALDVRTVKFSDMLIGTVFAPWVNGTLEAARTTYGGAVAGDLESVEVTLEQVGTYGAALVDTPGTLYVYTPTANEDQAVTSSASGAVTVTCANNYAKLKGLPKVTPQTTAARYPTIENISYGAVCTFELRIFNDAGALTATPCSITIEGTV